jgi:hypothetical protein
VETKCRVLITGAPRCFLTNRHFLAKCADLCFAFSEVSQELPIARFRNSANDVFPKFHNCQAALSSPSALPALDGTNLTCAKVALFRFSAEASQAIEIAQSAGKNSSK